MPVEKTSELKTYLRKGGRATLSLRPVPPFRLDCTVWALRRDPRNVVDRWDGRSYRRVAPFDDGLAELAVTQSGSVDDPVLEVELAGATPSAGAALAAVQRLLGTQTDMAGFYKIAEANDRLRALVQRFRGMKPPRFLTVFEAVVNGIACQQITLSLGILLLGRLSQAYGPSITNGSGVVHGFPRPRDLAGLQPDDLRRLGFSRNKGRAIIELAAAAASGLDLERLASLDDEHALEALLQLRGVGRWTAEYVMLRGLGRTYTFPADDVGGHNKLRQWLGLAETPDYAGVRRALAPWSPYAGLIYFHLLLNHLAEAGHIR